MTCIVGLVYKNKVYMGCDSLASNSLYQEIRKEPKIFFVGDYLIGGTDSFRMLNLLQYKFQPPIYDKSKDLLNFLCTDFVDALRDLFQSNGYNITTGDWTTGEILIGTQGRLFKIGDTFQVAEYEYTCCGSGEYFALGSLYTSIKYNTSKTLKPKKIILKSLECAEYFTVSVKRPFYLESF